MAAQALISREMRISEACRIAKDFTDRFYQCLNTERHLLKNMYEESGKLIFNGHGYCGPDAIGKFYENLPKCSARLNDGGFDAHGIDDKYLNGTSAILISAAGSVVYGNHDNPSSHDGRSKSLKPLDFFETFVITAKSGTWKIQSDSFRHQNCNTDSMLKTDAYISMQE
ncbi:NTF2-related export protein-like isoform X2 [Paramacrobiotus metropolitanus]|uniref:NTF2-related export protein-like isoform X2 n=1 Tax=Paramacrobiotus metropolitanus TaxID=2943436 RepID=UPI002445F3AC|nr:NTF2-related export protein-like isoform X2 [Paramacrobiotus metropolitanus]